MVAGSLHPLDAAHPMLTWGRCFAYPCSMNTGTYRHPHHDQAAELIHQGRTDSSIARELRMGRQAVARVRTLIGAAPARPSKSLEEKLAESIVAVDAPGGHSIWSGRRNATTPVVRHMGVERPAAALVFERRTGRKPVGNVHSDCDGHPQCMTPSHIMDAVERTQVRLQLRALLGYPDVPSECGKGHDLKEEVRIEPKDLDWYCSACNTARRPKKGN